MRDATRTGRRGSHAGPALVRGLLLASHPVPSLAVTSCASLLAAAAGAPPYRAALLATAYLLGQLSVGWSNDWLDAARDRAAGRRDKPVVAGVARRTTVARAAFVALVLAVPASLALGAVAGLVHLVTVASAWAYNLGAKRTAFSWLPYAVTFGLLPTVVTLSLPEPHLPPAWASAGAALLGVGAHLTNVLPDLLEDAATGVRGLPHRLGRTGSVVAAGVLLSVSSVLVVLGPPGPVTPAGWVALVLVAVLVASGSLSALMHGRSRFAFHATIAVAVVDVLLLLASGSALAS